MDSLVFLNAMTAMLVIIDPIGTALIFNALVGDRGFRQRVKIALKAVLISMLLIVVFARYGQSLLAQLGISIEALRIAGGLLLFYSAFHMVSQKLEYKIDDAGGDVSVFPMSVPLIAGPGSLTMAVLLYSSADANENALSVVLATLVVGAITFFALCAALPVKKVIGRTGDEVLRRFLGVLLAALAIQFVMDGINDFVVQH
ncbi:hypothetical protein A3742_07380 [Oleiphilus sp. HI0071]|uniref:MarC family protein n=1 Tax=Oleiphilus sp. HI0080 TaxID=1822255 RepID=UPI0007C376FE|nr:MarC family protein [Oleiphilus sp. HI0080]KZY62159.1 hypothetical protein A3737_15035 [Oleiphilus sp. HI0065]KZY79404.1 hypothetical protein A3742_21795 [Oleiphilus sp. HI0071]KZY91075.1 hypothetical protein A3744_04175 [Oleiphilus sp. HI0073]KZZ42098.1 hypothetical protein A3758_05825 [Oleiphilus sp. HI0118]KZZ60454.1 hypothetical protein A3760_06250 [Oleiphilus sp. HI0122]